MAARQGSVTHSLLQGSHSCSTKAAGVFVLKMAQNGVWGRRRWRDPTSMGRALGGEGGAWLQLSPANFMTLSQPLYLPHL